MWRQFHWKAHQHLRPPSSPGNVHGPTWPPHWRTQGLLVSFLSLSLYFLHSVHYHTSKIVKICLLPSSLPYYLLPRREETSLMTPLSLVAVPIGQIPHCHKLTLLVPCSKKWSSSLWFEIHIPRHSASACHPPTVPTGPAYTVLPIELVCFCLVYTQCSFLAHSLKCASPTLSYTSPGLSLYPL